MAFLSTAIETTAIGTFVDSAGELDSFLREAAKIPGAELPPPDLRTGHLVAGRYRLEARIGRGGFGEVWRAHDGLSGAIVAVKLLRRGAADAVARACREVAALRLLRLPGVVRLVDEGVEDDHPFLVMELARGSPFPGVEVPCPWPALSGPLARLLDALGGVHAAGFVHRDLKPENVLVDEHGNPMILDFGIARASSGFERITGVGAVIGTPLYLAPEQITDQPLTAATDLYAVGVMAFLALTGRAPHAGADPRALAAGKLSTPAPSVLSLAPEVPEGAALVIAELLATRPDDRPASGFEAAARLRAASSPRGDADRALGGAAAPEGERWAPGLASPEPPWVRPGDDPPFTEEEMRRWFSGPDRVLHLREDAAHLLRLRTNGIPSAVRRELARWTTSGVARSGGASLSIDRVALERLRAEGPDVLHLRGDSPSLEIAREALATADRLADAGAVSEATTHVREGLLALRRAKSPHPDALTATLSALVELAFADGGLPALDRALYELCRPGPTCPLAGPLTALVRAAQAAEAWTPRAAALAEAVPPFADPRLERLRHEVRVRSARKISHAREEEVLNEVGRWAESSGDPLALASHAHWLGRLRYFQNRFAEAARHHAEAARACDWPPLRLAALFHGGAAWMEVDLEAAEACAALALELAAEARLAFFELQAECLSRTIAFRAGRTDGSPPDLELVGIARLFGSDYWEGAIAVTEAAVAYRSSDGAAALDLADRAERAYAAAGHPIGTVLSRCLWVAAGGAPTGDEPSGLVRRARACSVPSIGLQCLALLARAGIDVAVSPEELAAMADTIPRESRGRRLDVLSVDEALEALSTRRLRASRTPAGALR